MKVLGPEGWKLFPADDRSRAWAEAALRAGRAAVRDPANSAWFRCAGTWFVGVNVLDTAPSGGLDGVPLAGPAADTLVSEAQWPHAWDRAQVSVMYPGYPKPREGESDAAFRYRRDRDAAHVDGILPVGSDRRRMAQEHHAFILGLPLTWADERAAPLVVWEGSHRLIADALRAALAPIPVHLWPETDLTEVYHAARRDVFSSCRRVILHAKPGEAYLVHRLSLHGVAPWEKDVRSDPEGRMIAYFRPMIDPEPWLLAP